LIRKAPRLTYADVTPKSVYLGRRKFSARWGLLAPRCEARECSDLAWHHQLPLAATKLTGFATKPFSLHRKEEKPSKMSPTTTISKEFAPTKATPAKKLQELQHLLVVGLRRRRVKKARKFSMDEIRKSSARGRITATAGRKPGPSLCPGIGVSFSNLVISLSQPKSSNSSPSKAIRSRAVAASKYAGIVSLCRRPAHDEP